MNKRVLVIDDDFANRMLPGLFLRGMGYEVSECANAQETYELLSAQSFTDLLLDISLPQVSGIDICRTLRQNPAYSDLRIIAYTAHAMPEEIKSFIDSGFDDLLIKPICESDLLKLFS